MKVKVTKTPSQFNQGGGIHIKPSHEGLFTQKANKHGMGVQQFASHVLANKDNYPTSTVRQANFARNASRWNAYGGSIFADGGQFEGSHTHGSDFVGPGDFTEFNTGSSHEMNGNEGVLQGYDNEGTPNFVEQGETKYDDYIFSARLTIPTTKELNKELKELPEEEGGDSQRGWEISILKKWAGRTYAYASKRAYREAEERPNDPHSHETLEEILGVLKNSQEKQRAIEDTKKQAEQEQEELESMSDKEYADAKEAEEQQQEQEQAMQEQQAQQQMQQQQMSPEEQAMMEQQGQMSPEEQAIMQQQMMQQGQPMACGGKLHAEGGELEQQEQAAVQQQQVAASYYQYLQQTKDPNKMRALQQRLAQYSQQVQQLPQEQQKAAAQQIQLQCLYEAAMQDADFINQLQQATQAYQKFAEGGMLNNQVTDTPMVEEAHHDDLTGITPTQDVEEMSTSQLNEAIDQIYQWAKQNGNKELARRARRAKKMSREEKEDFVDEAIDEVDQLRTQQQEQQRAEQQQAEEQASSEAQAQEEQQMSQDERSEALAAQELNSMMQPQMFAKGGNLFARGSGLNNYKTKSDIEQNLPLLRNLYVTDPNNTSAWDALFDSNGNIIARKGNNTGLYDPNGTYMKALSYLTAENWNDPKVWSESNKQELVNRLKTVNPTKYANLQVADIGNQGNYGLTWDKMLSLAKDGNVGGHHALAGIVNNILSASDDTTTTQDTTGTTNNTPTNSINPQIKYYLLDPGKNASGEDIPVTKIPAQGEEGKDGYLEGWEGQLLKDYDPSVGNKLYYYDDSLDRTIDGVTHKGLRKKKVNNVYELIDENGERRTVYEEDLEGLKKKGYVKSSPIDDVKDYAINRTYTLYKPRLNEEIPEYPIWPDAVGLGLTAATTLANTLSPRDRSAYKQMMGLANRVSTTPIMPEYRGDFISPRRFAENLYVNDATQAAAAQAAGIDNSSAGNRAMADAMKLAAAKQYYDSLGKGHITGQQFNATQDMQEHQYNGGIYTENNANALKAAMANRDNYLKSQQLFGDYFTKAIAFDQASREAKERAINEGLATFSSGLHTIPQNRWQNRFLAWNAKYNGQPGFYYGSVPKDELAKYTT